uniref:G patch domain-containing protein 4 n=1 Tax=Fundulus heteroclitus TaxID=8078 RepID=A0A3Q2Q8F5_FUNHE
MAETVLDKSRGLKFAEQQLLRHGWEQGKGLGRSENGISEAIKVKVKCDKGGVSGRPASCKGEQFTFHWWDHVFNKASSTLQVETDQDRRISNKKPRKSLQEKSKLYGCFVKVKVLSGPSWALLSDADLMKVCGGRTAHKGARHGLTMSAKLARLEQQEAEFLAKYGKTQQTGSCSAATRPTEETTETAGRKKKKAKNSTESRAQLNDDEVSESPETDFLPKKKKKKKKKVKTEDGSEAADEDVILVESSEELWPKKRKNDEEQIEDGGNPETGDQTSDCHIRRKKKKKRARHDAEPAETEEADGAESIQSDSRTGQEAEATMTTEKPRKKREKKFDALMVEADGEEVLPPKKKKKKSKGHN